MSRQAIAAALAREDLAGGERLVAFSLASFAGRDGRAWPGAPAAAARAGLSRSRYLYDRDQLVRRGLIVVEGIASGRGRSSTVALLFAGEGPWWDGEVNAELFEAVLCVLGCVVLRGYCSLRWQRSPAWTASCAASRAGSCQPRRGWRIGRTGVRAASCLSQASWFC